MVSTDCILRTDEITPIKDFENVKYKDETIDELFIERFIFPNEFPSNSQCKW